MSLFIVTGAAAQMPPGMTAVSGLYVNEDAGVQIEFPDGWEGFEIETEEALIVMTTMGQTSTKAIGLFISDKAEVTDPTDPNEFSQDTEMECGTPSVTSRTVAGRVGQEVTVECTDDAGVSSKMKIVISNTAEDYIIVLYMAPTAEFAADEAKFDAAVNTLVVEGAMDTEGVGGIPPVDGGVVIGLTAMTRTVVIDGANVAVDIRTNSTISQLDLDEENKRVSFTVDGQTGTTGMTEISIGEILLGPYTVTIGGQATTDFDVTNEGSVDAVMTITYTHSEHDIEITGTSVVPEFPVVVIGAIAAIVGVVAILGRTRLVRGQL